MYRQLEGWTVKDNTTGQVNTVKGLVMSSKYEYKGWTITVDYDKKLISIGDKSPMCQGTSLSFTSTMQLGNAFRYDGKGSCYIGDYLVFQIPADRM